MVEESIKFEGWDISGFAGKVSEAPTPWNYFALAVGAAQRASSMVDTGTGGGELLLELLEELGEKSPRNICATEACEANVPLARRRLEPRGVTVVSFTDDSRLPFGDCQFDLAINKHESFDPVELRRILRPGPTFLTQQVAGRELLEINALPGAPLPKYSDWSLEMAVRGLEGNGFRIEQAEEAMVEVHFADIGTLVGYLRIIEWQVPDFSIEKYREPIQAIRQRSILRSRTSACRRAPLHDSSQQLKRQLHMRRHVCSLLNPYGNVLRVSHGEAIVGERASAVLKVAVTCR